MSNWRRIQDLERQALLANATVDSIARILGLDETSASRDDIEMALTKLKERGTAISDQVFRERVEWRDRALNLDAELDIRTKRMRELEDEVRELRGGWQSNV